MLNLRCLQVTLGLTALYFLQSNLPSIAAPEPAKQPAPNKEASAKQDPPSAKQDPPSAKQDPPSAKQDPPSAKQDPPSAKQDLPSAKQDPPSAKQDPQTIAKPPANEPGSAGVPPASNAAKSEFDRTFGEGLIALSERKLAAGEKLLKDTLKMEAPQGATEPKRAQTLIVLADFYRTQKRQPEAEALYKQALAKLGSLKESEQGPYLLSAMNKLAALYKSQKKFDDAEDLYKKTLEAAIKRSGPESADEATVHANLGLLYQKMGKAKEAEAQELIAIRIFQTKLGSDSPEAAQCMSDLATQYMAEHKTAKALPLLESAFAIFEKKAPGKLVYATAADQLGTAYFADGKYAEAESLSRKALDVYQKILGPQNIEVAIALSNLGYRLSKQGKNQEALDCFNKSIAIQEKVMGQSNPDLLANFHGIAEIYVSQADFKKTEAVLRRELALREKIWGANHFALVPALKNLGNCLILEGAPPEESDMLFARADSIITAVPEEKRKQIEIMLTQDYVKGLDLNKKKGKKEKKDKNAIW